MMRSARPTLYSVLALAGVAAVTAGCGSQRTDSLTTVRPDVGANKNSTVDRRDASLGAARAFASSYGRYLDGRLPVTALVGATPAAHEQAGAPIPASFRAGTLTVAYVHRTPRSESFTVGYRDRAHSYSAQLIVKGRRARWLITQVLAPDLDSILRRSRTIPPAPGSRPAAAAARQFLAGYLAWLYGHARATDIHRASAQLIDQLKTHPPRVPVTLQHVHPRLIALGTQHANGGWLALANITAGQQTYQLTVTVVRARDQWRVTNVNALF